VVTTPDRLDWFSCSKRLHVQVSSTHGRVSPILIEQAVRYVLGNSSGAPEQVDVHEGTWEGFWSMIAGEA
jgi:hypothetical protein